MPISPERIDALKRLLPQRILLLDGAMGTMIQGYRLEEKDYRGERFATHEADLKGNNDLLNLVRPDVIHSIHRAYLDAGSDIIETNTFNATRISQADYHMESVVRELNVEGARIARQAADEVTALRPDRPRFVAGVIGPTGRTASISPDVNNPGHRNVTFTALVEAYREAVEGLLEGGADILLVETVFDTLNAKAAIFAILEHFDRTGVRVPIAISGTPHGCQWPHPVRPDRRGVLELGGPRRAPPVRAQLRPGRAAVAPLRRGDLPQGHLLHQHPSQRRPAQRLRRL